MVKISVLMPVYNTQPQYLREAIESILNQTCKDFELLIVNDCSSNPEVENIIKSYDDKRIRYEKNDTNLGISETRNKLMDLAKGKYLAVMDHDDISLPARLEEQAAYLDAHPEVGVVGCWHGVVGQDKVHKLPVENREIKSTMLYHCCMCHPATMIRKSAVVGLRYEKEFSPAEDYNLWCRLLDKTNFYNIPKVLFVYRTYVNNTTHRQRQQMSSHTYEINSRARRDYPELWAATKARLTKIKKIRLFGLIPFLTIIKKQSKTKVMLWRFLPLLSIKSKYRGD